MTSVETVDLGWLLFCSALVLLMQAGFTAVESGLVRSKSSINVAIKNFANFLVAASLFWLFGFGLMFGSDAGGIVGSSAFLFESDGAFLAAFFLFQLGFIGTATTLMSGAVAERMRFGGYLVLATFVAAVTYPVFGHWVWADSAVTGVGDAGGWLKELGFIDFAGSSVVHSVGGWVALAAIIILGPRIGRFGPGAAPIRADYLPLTTVGVFVLWVGWYGFNGGSDFALTQDVPGIILNTTLAATFGGLAGMALTWRIDGRPDVVVIMNASLAGLVGITASANIMSPWKAALIGAVAAVVMQFVTVLLERLRIDDAVGAVPVHLGAGIWGTLAVGLLGDVDSFPNASNNFEQLGIQLLGIGVCFVWAFGLGYVVLSLINRRFPFRIDPDGELAGLNIAEHGASTDTFDLLTEMDEHRRSGDFARPVRVEPYTEIGQIAAEYNRVLGAIKRRTDSLQLLRRTTAAANESSSAEDAFAIALDEVCAFTGWPIGHAFLVSRDDPDLLVSTGIWRLSDEARYAEFRAATEHERFRTGHGLPGIALETGKPVFGSTADIEGSSAEVVTLSILSLESPGGGSEPVAVPLEGLRAVRAAAWIDLGLRAGLAVPIMAGSEAVGVLEFFSNRPFHADAELLELLLSVGTQLGRVVERQRSEEARLRALVDNMPASVYLRDLAGRFILVNREYEEFWSVRHDEIRGKTLYEIDAMSELDVRPELNARIDREVLATRESDRREAHVERAGKEHVLADVRFPVRGQLEAGRGRGGHRHRHHGAETQRGRVGRAAAAGRDGARRSDGGGIREEPLPRQHEPRAADTAERDHRLHQARVPKLRGSARPAGRQSLQDPRERGASAVADRRHPRSLAGRSRRAEPRRRRDADRGRATRGQRFPRAAHRPPGREDGRGGPARPARGGDRPRQGQADPAEPGQQRDQVHGRRSDRVARRGDRRSAAGRRSRTPASGSRPTSSARSSRSSSEPTRRAPGGAAGPVWA